MVYKHRTQNGKIRHYQSRQHYLNSVKGMNAKDYQKKNHSRKINKLQKKNKRIQHAGVGKVSSGKKKLCVTCKREGLPLTKGKCKVCAKEFKSFEKEKGSLEAEVKELRIIKDGYQKQWYDLFGKKMRQQRGFGDHLPFPEEERLQEVLELYSKAHDKWSKKMKEFNPDYFKRGINTFRLGHEVDIKSGKEFCAMCKREGHSLTKGKCKVCRQAEKEYEKQSVKRKSEAEKRAMDSYIIDRISGGWGELKKSKQGKNNTRILFYKQQAYEPQNSSFVVQRMNEVTESEGRISSPQTNDSRQFSVRSGGLIHAIRKAKEYYTTLE